MATTQINGGTQIQSGTIVNAQIGSGAAIATSKLADGAEFVKRDGSVPLTGDLPAGSHKITGLTDPSAAQDAATKAYVDSVANGLDVKGSARASTTAALANSPTYSNGASGVGATLTAGSNVAFPAQDGITLVVNDRVLVKNQAGALQNGIYKLTTVGDGSNPWVLTRATDADTAAKVTSGEFVFVEEGTTLASTGWVMTTANPIVIGTTALTYAQFTGTGTITVSTPLVKTGNNIAATIGNGLTSPGGTPSAFTVLASDTSITVASGGISVATAFLSNHTVTRETPSGTINGSNTTFTLANTPLSGTEEVYLNGILQDAGAGNDYTISGVTITMLAAPITGDKIRVGYFF
jgi:hypothetical protein